MSPPRKEALRLGLLVVAVLIPVWSLLTLQQAWRAHDQQVRQVDQLLKLYGQSVSSSFQSLEADLLQLVAFLESHRDQPYEQFAKSLDILTEGLHADSRWVQAYQLVEDGIIRSTWPRQGNELVLGANLWENPDPRTVDGLQRAVESDALSLTGPITLMQGGTGFILRKRVTTVGSSLRVASVVVRLEPLLVASGLRPGNSNHLQIAIRSPGAEPFWGSAATNDHQPLKSLIVLPEGAWELIAIPEGGWGTAYWASIRFFTAAGAVMLVLAAAVTYLVSYRQQCLANAVAESSHELSRINERLAEDIRLREAAENALRESESRFRTIFEQAAMGVAVLDSSSGRFLQVNQRGRDMLRYQDDGFSSCTLQDVLCADEHMAGKVSSSCSLLDHAEEFMSEHRCRRKDGSLFWISLTVSPMRPTGTSSGNHIAIMEDITARKIAERQVARRDAILNAVARCASHLIASRRLDVAVPAILEELGRGALASCCYFFEFRSDDTGNYLCIPHYEWAANTKQPPIQIVKAPDVPIPVVFEETFRRLQRGDVIFGLTREFPEAERAILQMQQILSVAGVPVFTRGKLTGCLGFGDREQERSWSEIEIQALRAAADILGAAIDRQRSEETLRESEHRFRTLFEEAADGFVVVCSQGMIRNANRSAAEIIGVPLEALSGCNAMDLIAPEDRRRVHPIHGRVQLMRGETVRQELSVVAADGERVPVEICTRRLDDKSYLTIIRDLRARHEADAALKDQQDRMRVLADTLPGQLLYVDRDERIQYMNASAYYRFRETSGDAMWDFYGQPVSELFTPDEYARLKPWIQRALNGESVEFTALDEPENPYSRCRSIIYAPHRTKDGLVPGFFALETDITDRRRAEQKREELERQLTQAQKMEAVGTLAGGIAHDFNNMLQVILGYTDILLVMAKDDSSQTEHLVQIKKAARRSSDLTHQLLAFARKQTVVPVPVNLHEAVPRMLRLMRRAVGEDIDLTWLPTTDLWNTVIDPAQLDQILANLLVNARDAIQGSGRIVVSARNVPAEQEFESMPSGWSEDFVALEVCDNGCGMSDAIQTRIFEPFFTTKDPGKGSGLGLATVYGIVTQNNGTIRVKSAPGKGTSITMYFPAYRGTVAEQELVPIQHSPNTGRETILLVEDEPMVLSLAQSLLQRLGYRVIATRSPMDAIRIAESDTQSIHLLITDVIMPEMNGKQLADLVLARKNEVRVLYMSGFSADVIALRGVLEEGAQFLQKPFTPGELASRVREVLEATTV